MRAHQNSKQSIEIQPQENIKLNDKKNIVYASFILHQAGLIPIGNPTFEQWLVCGDFIKKAEGAVHFWIGDWLDYGEKRYGEMYNQAIEQTGYDYQTLANDKYVAGRIEFSRRRENLTFRHHADVVNLPPQDQDTLLSQAEKNNISSTKFRQFVREYRYRQLKTPEIPEGEFNIIYADPPWKYEFTETYSREVENYYPVMDLEEIKAIKVPSAQDAILYLWATAPKIKEAVEVMTSWDFTYRTCAVWDKEIMGMGYWFRIQHELLLVGMKGNLSTPQPENRINSIYREKRGGHSKKPDYFYSVIEKMYPNGRYLELFARNKRKGWVVWGNQLNE